MRAFHTVLQEHGLPPLAREHVTTLQVNVGRLCNIACHHCHVEAGPKRTEIMPASVADSVIALLERHPRLGTLDLTGGAPEMNPNFKDLVRSARRLEREVIDRCNLTVFFEPGHEELPEFLASEGVRIVASLPCYTEDNVDQQRGDGVFDGSIRALQRLNQLGYGQPGSPLVLDLVYNPLGPSLPPPQAALEEQYRDELGRRFGIQFHRLFTITNMPIRRFAASLNRLGKTESYMSLLVNHFNPETVPGLMCRSLLSVGWDGRLYDCDFNLMLDMPLGAAAATEIRTINDLVRQEANASHQGLSLDDLTGQRIATGSHCFGCAAGAGSSCGGALA
ncbi:MAG: arsenosugar biosynthesis radical SAM (seleno)protein ArsS [Vicinamibacterales bacterium]